MAVGFAVYWNSLPAPFAFDDDHAIVINEQIRHLSTSLSPTEQGSPLAGRPLVSLTFAINYAIGQLNVWGYRLVNIAIHIINALLVFSVVGRALRAGPVARTFPPLPGRVARDPARQCWLDGPLRGPSRRTAEARSGKAGQVREASLKGSHPYVAFAVALVWMVHPLTTEPVDYVSQRTELMMGTFFLLTLYFAQHAAASAARRDSTAWLWTSVASCALGMACKETMVVAPIVVFLYDRTFTFGSLREALRRRGWYYAALCATWLVLVALLWSSPRGDSAGFVGASVSPWTYLLDQSVMIVRYLRLAFWPRGLVLDYGEPAHVTFAEVAPYVITVTALVAATIAAVVRNLPLGFLGAWFFLTLAPTSSIMPISTEVGAERRMYLPLMAIVALVIVVGRALTARLVDLAPRKVAPYTGGTLAFVVAALLSIATIQRNAEYRSGLTLWQTVLERWPPHARAHRNLAAELKLVGRHDEEIEHLRAAVKDLPELRNVLGVELLALGRNAEAADELRIYLRDAPRDADAWSNFGNALAALGRNDEALEAYEHAVAVDPKNGLSQRNLALQYLQRNDFDNAVAHARDGVRLTPDDPSAHNLLGLALIGQQKIDEAIAEFRSSLRLQPANNDAAGYLERTLKAIGR